MDFESVKSWLTNWTVQRGKTCQWKAILGLALMPIGLAAGGAIVFFICLGVLYDRTPHANNDGIIHKCIWIALAILPVLFIANRFIARRDVVEERMREGPADTLVGRYFERRTTIILFMMWIVFTGPRLLDWAISSFREKRKLKQMDVHSCAAILWLLLARGKKVPFDDMQREFDWLNLEATVPELYRIPGVVPLQQAPPGLSLTQDLRDEIQRAIRGI